MIKSVKQVELRVRRLAVAAEDRAVYQTPVTSPATAAAMLRLVIGEVDVEHFAVIMVDAKNKPVGTQVVAQGGLASCQVEPSQVFRAAVVAGAVAVIVGHNHPTGDPTPSNDDLKMTKRLKAAGEILGVQVLDHVIVTDDSHCSLAELGAH